MWQGLINFGKFLLFLGLGMLILWLVYRSQNAAFQEDCALKGVPAADCSLLDKVWQDFTSVRWGWIVLVLTAFTLSNVSRALRWQMLIRPLGYRPHFFNAFWTTVLGYFANLGLPRLGEVVRAGSLARYEHIAIEKVMGTVVVDRVFDVISILLVTSLAIVLEFDQLWGYFFQYADWGSKAGMLRQVVLWGVPAVVLGLIFTWFLRHRIRNSALYRKVRSLVAGFGEGISSFRQIERPWLFLFHSMVIWGMYYLMTYLCFFSFAPTAHLGAVAALVVFVAGGWGIVIPSPGGMGTYHFLAQTALGLYGVGGDDGFSWANIAYFSIQLGGNVLMGILALMLLPVFNRRYHPQQVDNELPG